MLRRSIHAGEAGHAAAIERIKPGMTELDAFLVVQQAATEAAGEPVIVYGDFASGPRIATDRGGPPTVADDRAGGPLPARLLGRRPRLPGRLHQHVRRRRPADAPASASCSTSASRPCRPARPRSSRACRPAIVDAGRARVLRVAGLAQAFPSHTGHGIGLSHPEPPYFVPESTDTVVVGDVVAIEPGLYVPGVGGMRFEHNYLVTPTDSRTLTRHRIALEP